jgi:hypothetical protein
LILLSILFIAPPFHAVSFLDTQAQPLSHLKISSVSVSEARSTIDSLTTNASDALFTFCDPPTITSIPPAVSAPDGDSNEYKLVSNPP